MSYGIYPLTFCFKGTPCFPDVHKYRTPSVTNNLSRRIQCSLWWHWEAPSLWCRKVGTYFSG